MEKKYSSDIEYEAYNEIKDIIEEKRRGPKGKYTERSKLNAFLYLLVNGSSYRNLPSHFPAFRSVFKFKKKLETVRYFIVDLKLVNLTKDKKKLLSFSQTLIKRLFLINQAKNTFKTIYQKFRSFIPLIFSNNNKLSLQLNNYNLLL